MPCPARGSGPLDLCLRGEERVAGWRSAGLHRVVGRLSEELRRGERSAVRSAVLRLGRDNDGYAEERECDGANIRCRVLEERQCIERLVYQHFGIQRGADAESPTRFDVVAGLQVAQVARTQPEARDVPEPCP